MLHRMIREVKGTLRVAVKIKYFYNRSNEQRKIQVNGEMEEKDSCT